MLVLSRRTNEKIVFPTLDATIQVVSIQGGTVRLGIEAPPHVPVRRAELLDRGPAQQRAAHPSIQQVLHQLNNRLNSSTIALALLRRQLDLGLSRQMESTLGRLDQELGSLRRAVESLAAPPQAASRRALLVEDDANECELLAGFLRLAGLEVDTAGDGGDALDYLRARPRPDVVLMDMMLPRCDGPTAVRAIRSEPGWAGLRIFGVTGADPSRFNLPEGPGGIDRWFHKPLNPEALLAELKRELGAER